MVEYPEPDLFEQLLLSPRGEPTDVRGAQVVQTLGMYVEVAGKAPSSAPLSIASKSSVNAHIL
eukprot:3382969-Pyramimonas_sp.AAC.1